MKKILSIIILAASCLTMMADNDKHGITANNINVENNGAKLFASFDLVLDNLRLKKNQQFFITPYVEGANGKTTFPTILVNGRNMQYVYERSGLSRSAREEYPYIYKVVRRKNGKAQSINYTEAVDMAPWMTGDVAFHLAIDSCGCGKFRGNDILSPLVYQPTVPEPEPEPVPEPKHYDFEVAYITPPVTELPVSIHEGRARVQFEVNHIELHTEPYLCRSGQIIDNRAQLQIIRDSIEYALRDPNVEIQSVNICGFASPESPYVHNEYLSTNRSRVLAEYLGFRYNLPSERTTYNAVTENWGEFREQVLEARDITERQRQDLLQLIDAPTYGPADFDAKETTLKTDPRFAALYRDKILPLWFPQLRCTQFTIKTQLKPTSDEKLAELIKTMPGMLSLNQMYRVARLYKEGSKEFNETFKTALRFYADDPVANLNAAIVAINEGDYERAARLLVKAGDSPEAENARGIVAANQGDYEAALEHFIMASSLPEAKYNKSELKNKK